MNAEVTATPELAQEAEAFYAAADALSPTGDGKALAGARYMGAGHLWWYAGVMGLMEESLRGRIHPIPNSNPQELGTVYRAAQMLLQPAQRKARRRLPSAYEVLFNALERHGPPGEEDRLIATLFTRTQNRFARGPIEIPQDIAACFAFIPDLTGQLYANLSNGIPGRNGGRPALIQVCTDVGRFSDAAIPIKQPKDDVPLGFAVAAPWTASHLEAMHGVDPGRIAVAGFPLERGLRENWQAIVQGKLSRLEAFLSGDRPMDVDLTVGGGGWEIPQLARTLWRLKTEIGHPQGIVATAITCNQETAEELKDTLIHKARIPCAVQNVDEITPELMNGERNVGEGFVLILCAQDPLVHHQLTMIRTRIALVTLGRIFNEKFPLAGLGFHLSPRNSGTWEGPFREDGQGGNRAYVETHFPHHVIAMDSPVFHSLFDTHGDEFPPQLILRFLAERARSALQERLDTGMPNFHYDLWRYPDLLLHLVGDQLTGKIEPVRDKDTFMAWIAPHLERRQQLGLAA